MPRQLSTLDLSFFTSWRFEPGAEEMGFVVQTERFSITEEAKVGVVFNRATGERSEAAGIGVMHGETADVV